MPAVPLHVSPHLHPGASSTTLKSPFSSPITNPLPALLQTPSGLAILEIQGTLNLPSSSSDESALPVGKLVFPYYDPNDVTGSKAWMKTVYLYVGKHQRLTGEVKELPKALGVVRRREAEGKEIDRGISGEEELEIMEIVEWKVVFSSRPEPVGG